jgi:pyrroline-5-carboxylate reductase
VSSGKIWLIGCGNMGGAMLRRWIAAGTPASSVTVIDPGMPAVPADVALVAAPPPGDAPDTVVLAIKPQQLDDAVAMLGAAGSASLVVSILAGVEEATLRARLGDVAVVRAMPNLPVAIGKGVVALYSGTADAAIRARADALAAPLGLVEWIADEALFDAVTALSGCGPGFVFRFIDALAEAGAALGLPADQADRLARATVEGTGIMAMAAPESPATLADRVASPGGSTREGLNVLDRHDALKGLLRETLEASARRNAEMAAAAR